MLIKFRKVLYAAVLLVGNDLGFASDFGQGQEVSYDSLQMERLPAFESRVDELEHEVAVLRSRFASTNEVFANSDQFVGFDQCGDSSCNCPLGTVWPVGMYGGLSGGYQARDIGVDINLGTAAEWSPGFGLSGLVGFRTNFNVRAEFEASILDNENERFYFPPYPTGPVEQSSGHVTLRSYMFNLYYDMPLDTWAPNLRRWRPYFGVGLGATESRINGVTSATLQAGIPGAFAPTVLDTASPYVYTWQSRVGFSYLCTDQMELFGGWRHLETRTLAFKTVQFPDVTVTGANVDELEFGFRFFF